MELQTLTSIGRYATPEVITVVGALFTAWIGWKIAAKSFGLISALAQKASFIGLVTAILCVSGFSSIGLGVGELAHWIYQKEPIEKMDNGHLVEIAARGGNSELAETILAYAQQRDLPADDNEFLALYELARKTSKEELTTEDREAKTKVLLGLIELAKAKQGQSNDQLVSLSNYTPTKNVSYDFKTEPVVTPPTLSMLPISAPIAVTLIGFGIGLLCCSVACNDRRMVAKP